MLASRSDCAPRQQLAGNDIGNYIGNDMQAPLTRADACLDAAGVSDETQVPRDGQL
jgi:hypothetical protein